MSAIILNKEHFHLLKSYQNVQRNHAKINIFGAKGLPKPTKMVPRSAPKVILENGQF